jgi:hypothetical protein
MHPADIPKTTIGTPFGLLEFLRMTFGSGMRGTHFSGGWIAPWQAWILSSYIVRVYGGIWLYI